MLTLRMTDILHDVTMLVRLRPADSGKRTGYCPTLILAVKGGAEKGMTDDSRATRGKSSGLAAEVSMRRGAVGAGMR